MKNFKSISSWGYGPLKPLWSYFLFYFRISFKDLAVFSFVTVSSCLKDCGNEKCLSFFHRSLDLGSSNILIPPSIEHLDKTP